MTEQNLSVSLVLNLRKFVDGFRDAKQVASSAAQEIGKSATIHTNVDTKEAVNAFKQLGTEGGAALKHIQQEEETTGAHTSELKEKFGEVGRTMLGVFGGGALLGGVQGLTGGFEGLVEKGKAVYEMQERMELAFEGNEEAIKAANQGVSELSEKYAMPIGRLKELSATARITGGATGQFNKDIVELAAGLEKFNVPGVSADQVMRAFMAGAGDPEGSANLGRLTKAFPVLAHGLDGITDPAEKAKKALELMGPKFAILAEQADGPVGASERLSMAFTKVKSTLGGATFGAMAGAAPVLTGFASGILAVLNFVKNLPGPLQTVLKVVAGLTVAIGIATAAESLHLAAKVKTFIQTGKDIVIKTAETAVRWAGVAATIAQTAATWALNAAMVVLTSPITLIVLGIAALAAGVIYAYNHFAFFKTAIDAVWGAIKTAAGFVWKFKEYLLILLGPVGLVIEGFIQAYRHLGFFRDAVDAVVGAVKSAVNWIGDLFSSSEELSPALKKNAEEAKKVADAQAEVAKEAQAATAAFDAQRKSLDEGTKSAEAQIAVNLQKKQQAEAVVRTGMVNGIKLTAEQIDAYRKMIPVYDDANKALVKYGKGQFAAANGMQALTDAGVKAVEGEKDKADKKSGGGETQQQKFQRDYDAAKTHQEALHTLALNGLQKELEENPAKEKEIKRAIEFENMDHAEKMVGIHTEFSEKLKTTSIKNDSERKKIEEDFQLAISGATLDGSKARVAINASYNDEQAANDKARREQATADYKQYLADKAEAERESRAIRDDELTASNAEENEKALQALENKLDDDNAANEQAFDKGLISFEEFEAKKNALAAVYSRERVKLIEDEVRKSNIVYATGLAMMQKAFSIFGDRIKAAIHSLFSTEATEDKKAKAVQRRLDEIERQKKIAGIKHEIEESKISREEGLLQIEKLNAESNAKDEAQAGEHQTAIQSIAEAGLTTLTDVGNNFLQKRVEQNLTAMLSDQATAQASAAKGLFATIPNPFVALALEAGVMIAIGSLFSGILGKAPKKAMKGIKHDPSKGGEMVYMEGSHEGGRTEFVAPEHEFLDYAQKELGPKVVQRFETALVRSLSTQGKNQFRTLYYNGGIPPVSPALSSGGESAMFGRLSAMLEKQHAVLTDLQRNGVSAHVNVTGELKMGTRALEAGLRMREKEVNRRSGTSGGGMR